MVKKKGFGLIIEPRRPTDWQLGGFSGVENAEVLREDGQWDSYIPPYEGQRFQYFDSMSCVSFSALNCIETLIHRKFDEVVNFSDRFTATTSGTTDTGNSFFKVAESIRKDGLVLEEEWPYFAYIKTRADYFASIPSKVLKSGESVLDEYNINYEFVFDTPEGLMEALKYAPIQVGIYAYCPEEGGINAYCAKQGNHAIMLYGYEEGKYWKLFDHYTNKFRKVAWNYKFWGALKYHIEKKPKEDPMAKFEEGTLYQYVTHPGGFYLFLGGKMRLDSLDNILASWLVAGKGDTTKVGTLEKADLEGVTFYNLKSEELEHTL